MNLPRSRMAWAGAMAGVLVLLVSPALVGDRTLSRRDTDRLYAPARTLVVDALRSGRLPLWNPYEGTGKPLFAEGLHSVLHPVSLVGAVLAPTSVDFLIVFYLLVTAAGAFVLAQVLGASAVASAAAGLAYALSGYTLSMTGNLVFLAGLSTLPWVMAAGRRCGTGERWSAVASAIAIACAFLAGDTQVAAVGIVLSLVLAGDAGGLRGIVRCVAPLAVGLLLAGVQIEATRELLPRTYRSLDLSQFEKELWALDPARLAEWVIPGLFRGPLSGAPGGLAGMMHAEPFAESVYLGVPLLVAAYMGASRSRADGPGRPALALAVAAVALGWLALGHHLGGRQAFEWVPVWNRFRYSEKLMAPVTACACAAGALGFDAFAAAPLAGRARRALALVAVLLAAALGFLAVAGDATTEVARSLAGDSGPFYRANAVAGLPHAILALVAVLAADRLRPPGARAAALALAAVLATAAALPFGAHFGRRDVRHLAASVRLDSDGPAPRLAHPAEGLYAATPGLDYVDSTARIVHATLVPAVNVARRVDAIGIYGGFDPRRFTTLSRSLGERWPRASRRYALTHVALGTSIPIPEELRATTELAIAGGALVARDEAAALDVYAVPHRPWAFFAERALAFPSPQAAHEELLRLIDGGDDRAVVVEGSEQPATSPGRVLAVERGTERVRVDAEADGTALLVVQDAHWPGWRATVDGQPAELLIADILVRAVRWPPGRHRLEMVYDPPGVRRGLIASAAGAVLLAVLVALGARRRRADAPPAGPDAPGP